MPTRIWVICGLACSLMGFFYPALLSGFEVIHGDLGDPRIALAILEHWWQWLLGHEAWTSPPFFYPETGVLGYTDAYLLIALPYVTFRGLGADQFVAMELAFACMKSIGYLGMVWLLNRGLAIRIPWAIFGGVLFSLLNAMTWHAIHIQLATVAVIPWLIAVLLSKANGHTQLYRVTTLLLLLAGIFLTSFYIGFFAVLCLVPFVILLTSQRLIEVSVSLRDFLISLTIYFVAMVPFFWIYYPVSIEKIGHTFSTVLSYSLYGFEIIRVGPDNLIWGWLETALYSNPLGTSELSESNYIANYERISGFTPGIVLVFIGTMIYGAFNVYSQRLGSAYNSNRPINKHLSGAPILYSTRPEWMMTLSFGLVAVLAWLLSSRWGDLTAWYWIYSMIPGGNAVRVPSRLLVFVSAFVIPVVVYGLWMWFQRVRLWPVVIACFLLIEQINTGPVHNLFRRSELGLLKEYSPPPDSCEVFYIKASRQTKTGYSLLDGFYVPNVDAMLLALHWRVPTLNGISTWSPAGWALERPESPNYSDKVRDWGRLKGLDPKTLCSLDMKKKEWTFPAFTSLPYPNISLNKTSLEASTDSPNLGMLTKGWSRPERWGTWSESKQVSLTFNASNAIDTLILNLQAYAAEKDPVRLSVKILTSETTHELTIKKSEPSLYELKLADSLTGRIELNITIHNPRRPIDQGLADTRWLGIGLISLSAR